MRTTSALSLILPLLAALAAPGCGPRHAQVETGPYRTVVAEPRRDTQAAQRHNAKGLELLDEGKLDEAADAFNLALTADVEFGPAHNNLGKVYFLQKIPYKAAIEFDYARKLMPRSPEPLNNLGVLYETLPQPHRDLDRAAAYYRQAIELDPSNTIYAGNLARTLTRRGDRSEELRQLLVKILAEDRRPDWLIWARQMLTRIGE